jgi:hypothetical protein
MSGFSGPMFEGAEDEDFKSIHGKRGGHYNNFAIKPGRGMSALRHFFPDGEADEMNFVLFSTSGIHGSYVTLEEIEASLKKYGVKDWGDDDGPDDYLHPEVTVLIVQPRICTLRHGNAEFTIDDVEFLKRLRASSHRAVQTIGMPDPEPETDP